MPVRNKNKWEISWFCL